MAKILDGKLVSCELKEEVKQQTTRLKALGITPGLAVVLVGDDRASQIYVNNKQKDCEFVGFYSKKYELPEQTTQEELLSLIYALNDDNKIDGILVQLPIPKHIDTNTVINAINPLKDVDAFTECNVGKIMLNNYDFLPCTPAGIMELLHHYNIDISGKECVVVGRSNIVGKPMAMLLLHEDATVTICHSKTENIEKICKRADILVSAVGKAHFITADMVKQNAVIVDVGMNRDEEGKLCGDVCFEQVEPIVSAITPVPGGVGPMTRAILLKNTLSAAKKRL